MRILIFNELYTPNKKGGAEVSTQLLAESLVELGHEIHICTSSNKNSDEIINGVRVGKNFQADRLQLYFEGKPSTETISTLKHSAFKWSPSNGCWQRQLTNNAIYAMQTILKNL